MAKLKDRIKFALDEGRMLILGSQVLVGFQFRSMLEKGFEALPQSSQYLKLCALGLMLLTIGLLMSPGAYHRIVEEGEDTPDVHKYTTMVLCIALLPFAVAFGLDMYVVTRKLSGYTPGILAGLALGLIALFFWYGLEMLRKAARAHEIKEIERMEEKNKKDEEGGAKLKDKIEQALTEARVVLPGAQALLGFQFASMLVEGFDKLPASSRYVHLASLALMALAVVLLMAPAAYHRIVEEGHDTEHFHRVASRFLIAAMIPLALGICGDLFVVVRKVTESATFGLISAAVMLLFFYGLWFGYTIYRRNAQAGSKGAARSQVTA
jgi:predicted histidine transporter YuiF (NhaC family)